jgi:hypothetical protein
MRSRLIFIAFGTAQLMWAQIDGPRLGLVPDGAHIRPMNGIPGAAALGDGLHIGRGLTAIAISPRQDYALAVADDGKVLLIAAGNRVWHIREVADAPDRTAISPRASHAALWYAATSHFQVVSGLPGASVVHEIDATFLGSPKTFAVSDDGWIAGVWDAGVYAFGPDGSGTQLQVDEGVAALSFFAGGSDLGMATPSRIFSLRDIAGNSQTATIYDTSNQPTSPVGLGISADNQAIAAADAAGVVYGMDLEKGALAILNCDCTPEGVFPLSGSAFRLTSPASGLVKLFDVRSASILVVPDPLAAAPSATSPTAAATTIPALTIGGLPATSTFAQQLPMTISIASAFTSDISGTATLTFQSASGGDDQMIQFGTGGRTVNFTIAAGSTQAVLAGKSSVAVLTGTVAGKITITVTVTSPADSPPTTATITTAAVAPVISTVTLSQTSGGLTVVVTGYTPTREISSGVFSFSAGSGSTLAQANVTVQLGSAFAAWFGNTASSAFGSEFTLTVPFNVQGNANNVVRVAVDLTNAVGVSNVASSQ